MLEQIKCIKEQGFKPAVYIDNSLSKMEDSIKISRKAREHNIPVFFESNLPDLHKLRKAYLFRYGYLPQYSEASVKRKGGKIVSGNLKVN